MWGTGRFPTLSRRRGHAGETWFPPRTRAEGERCSSAREADERGQEDDAGEQVPGRDHPGEEELGDGDADRDVDDSGGDVQGQLAPAGGQCIT